MSEDTLEEVFLQPSIISIENFGVDDHEPNYSYGCVPLVSGPPEGSAQQTKTRRNATCLACDSSCMNWESTDSLSRHLDSPDPSRHLEELLRKMWTLKAAAKALSEPENTRNPEDIEAKLAAEVKRKTAVEKQMRVLSSGHGAAAGQVPVQYPAAGATAVGGSHADAKKSDFVPSPPLGPKPASESGAPACRQRLFGWRKTALDRSQPANDFGIELKPPPTRLAQTPSRGPTMHGYRGHSRAGYPRISLLHVLDGASSRHPIAIPDDVTPEERVRAEAARLRRRSRFERTKAEILRDRIKAAEDLKKQIRKAMRGWTIKSTAAPKISTPMSPLPRRRRPREAGSGARKT